MTDREALRAAFLDAAGWGDADQDWRAGDASFRRYARLRLEGRTAMLMDAPPPKEDVRPFLAVGDLLARAGLATPRPLAVDEAAGFLLLEDFGDDTFTRLLDAGADPAPLYDLAIDALIRLRQAIQERPDSVPHFSAAARVDHLSTVLDWLWPEVLPGGPTEDERRTFNALWLAALQAAPTLGEGLVHRDFHVDNLMRLNDGRCGVLDFQDAGWGPLAYDLASLVEDARRPLAQPVKDRAIKRYLAAFPHLTDADVQAALAVHGGQRHMRVAGLWVRLWRRDGKPGYLRHMERTWTLLEASLAHPLLADVRGFLDVAFPPAARQRAVALGKAAP